MKQLLTTLLLLALAGSLDAGDRKARGRAAWALAVATVKTSDEMPEKPSTARDIVTPLYDIWRHTNQPCTTGV